MPVERFVKVASKDVTCDLDLTNDEVLSLIDLAQDVKSHPHSYARALSGRIVSLLFEKPSLRTRMTFEVAMKQLGGDAIFSNGMIGGREPIKDVARNLDRWTQGIVARVFSHETIKELSKWSSVPVVNALCDMYHPCQALADALTLKERFGDFAGLNVAFIGDGNNVAHSLMLTCARLGANFTIATPKGYEPNSNIVEQAKELAAVSGASVRLTHSPEVAAADANAIYTDVWTSMGSEHESDCRKNAFADYQVSGKLFSLAAPDAVFMHCLPAHRGEEVTEEVIEAPSSVVFDQAENRLHAQKALLLMLLE
ncbi:MAG: ornithine carbamoyltransferase [bacterium]